MSTDHIDADALSLRPLTDEEYAAFRARTTHEYAEEIARNFGVNRAAADERATTQIDELLPDGLATPGHHFLAIVRGASDATGAPGHLVGELWLAISDKLGGLEAFGYDFWIRPELRDSGLGRAAMDLVTAFAREHGAVRLALNVFGDNARARHLYESFGFQVTSTNMTMHLN